jgi:succinoglycan biosynthesis protein ExoA
MQDTGIFVRYHVRDSFVNLFRQFMQYGYWKVRVVQKHPQQASLRHFIPSVFVMALLIASVASVFLPLARLGGLMLLAIYLATLSLATLGQVLASGKEDKGTPVLKLWPGTVWALILMHIGYGSGFLLGWLRVCCGPLPTDSIFERVSR